jgi:hypothetical protein
MKVIRKEVQWNFGLLKSPNFWVQALTVILMLVVGLGTVFPEGTVKAYGNSSVGDQNGITMNQNIMSQAVSGEGVSGGDGL